MKLIMVGMTEKRLILITVTMKMVIVIMGSIRALLPGHHRPDYPRSPAHPKSPTLHTSPSRIVWEEEGERW